MEITILANRLRTAERWLMEALERRGHRGTLCTPADIGSTLDSRRVLMRLPAGPEAAAIASALEEAGLEPIPSAQQLGLLSNRARVRRVLQMTGLPLQTATVAFGAPSILDAADQAGWPVEIVPLNASESPVVASDRDTAEAIVEHRSMLGGQHVLIVRPAARAERRLLAIGNQVLAASHRADHGWIASEATEAERQIAAQIIALLGLDLLQIDLSADCGAIVEVGPIGDYRGLQEAGLDVSGALASHLCPTPTDSVTINPHQPAELLTGLVRIPSLSGCESVAVGWLTDQMDQLGYRAYVDPAGNAVGTRGSGPLEIVMLGHIDTVPGQIDVQVEDGILHGRGAVDAKGPLAAFVSAGARAALPDGVRLTVIGAVGEESAGSPGATWLRDHYDCPAAVIIGEPSGWDGVVLGYKGSVAFTASTSRPMTHSAGPESTAPERLMRFWAALSAWVDSENAGEEPGFNALDATLRKISSNSDGLTDTACMEATFRLPPAQTSSTVIEAIDQIAVQHEVTIAWSFNAEAYRVGRSSPLVAPFLAAIRAQGGKPRLKVKTGTSDMNVVGPVWQCPIVAYGPGDASFDHRPDEQISLAELDLGVQVLIQALETYANRIAETASQDIYQEATA